MLEELANLEHEQWAHWTRYMLNNLTPENIERWKGQCDTPYSELSEKEKESDREWARKVMTIASRCNVASMIGDGPHSRVTCSSEDCGAGTMSNESRQKAMRIVREFGGK